MKILCVILLVLFSATAHASDYDRLRYDIQQITGTDIGPPSDFQEGYSEPEWVIYAPQTLPYIIEDTRRMPSSILFDDSEEN